MVQPQVIIPFAVLTICCLISTILAFTVGDRVLPGDDNYSARVGTQATYTLCTISCSALCIGAIVMVVRSMGT